MLEFLVHAPGCAPSPLTRRKPVLHVGRAPGLDLVLLDPAISRKHAKFLWSEGKALLEDLGSRHGCYVNGARINGLCQVRPEDRIRLGEVELKLESMEETSSTRLLPFNKEATVTLSLSVDQLRGWPEERDLLQGFPGGPTPMDILHRLSLDLVGRCSTRDLLAELLDRLFTFLNASQGIVFLREPGGNLEILAARTREGGEPAIQLSEGTLEALFDRKQALLMDTSPLSSSPEEASAADRTTRSVMAVPLESQGEVLGLYYFDAGVLRPPFTANEIRFVVSLSNLAAAKVIHQRTSEELYRKTDLERQILALESTARAKGELLAFMSHEIRNPLMAIITYLELAQAQPIPEAASKHLQKADKSGNTLLKILNDVLDYSKLEAGRLDLERVPFRLSEVLTTVVDMFLPRAEGKGLKLVCEVGPGIQDDLQGDPIRLGQVLINLVGNAVKFTETGEIILRVDRDPDNADSDQIRFSVADTGIGIASEPMARLFQPYAQVEPAASKRRGGTGLGLFISRRLVEMQGGTIRVESQPGKGSTFSFRLGFESNSGASTAQLSPAQLAHFAGLASDSSPSAGTSLSGSGAQQVSKDHGEQA
jgi:signal transduction histidine kinase